MNKNAAIEPKIFKEYDIRGLYPAQINELFAYRLGLTFVRTRGVKKIVIGRDRRRESAKLMPFFARGAKMAGAAVYNLGETGTTTLSFAAGFKNFDAAVMATASHNPIGYGGFKLFDRFGLPVGEKSGLKKLAKAMAVKTEKEKADTLSVKKITVNNVYFRHLAAMFDFSVFNGFKVILDMSGGSGGRLVEMIFRRLPCKIIKANFRSHDRFKDHGPNPLLEENQLVVEKEIKKQKADLGLLWDADADRIVFFDENGDMVHPYHLNCLLGQIILAKKPKTNLVVDARMVMGISRVIKAAGGRAIVSRSGTANIIKMMRQKKSIFGCENSGHYYFNFLNGPAPKKNYVYSDTIVPALLVMEFLAQKNQCLSVAVDDLRKNILISGEINFKADNFKKLEKKLKDRYRDCKFDYIDGFSVFGPGWFFNVRPSHTEPLVRLNIEAGSLVLLNRLEKELKGVINDN